MTATLRIGAILLVIAAHYLWVNAEHIEFNCFDGTLKPEYRITRVLTPSRPERRYVIAVPCDWRGDRTIWISKEFNSNVSIPPKSVLAMRGSVLVQGGTGRRFPSVVNASVLLEDVMTRTRVFKEMGAGAKPTKSFLLEIEDAVALENAKIPWTSQKFCVSNVILTATGAGVVVVLILVLVAVVLVTWRCTKCLGKSSRDDQDSTRTPSELRAELGNGK